MEASYRDTETQLAAPPPLGRSTGLSRAVDRSLPWIAGSSILAGVTITALSSVPSHLPGIALDSTPLFLVERGIAVIAALVIVTGLVGRTLKQELPSGFSPATGSITYTDNVKEAASASDAAAAALKARIDRHDETLSRHEANIGKLAEAFDERHGNAESLRKPPNPPGT